MNISTQVNTSKSDSACRCNKDCGCCSRKKVAAEPEATVGFLRKRPWIWVVVAFMVMFSAWTVMFTMAIKHQPEIVPMVVNAAE